MKRKKRKKIEKRKSYRRTEVNTKNIKANPPPLPLPPAPPLPLVQLQKAVVRVTKKRRKERKTDVQEITVILKITSLRKENFTTNFLAVIVTRKKSRKSLVFLKKRVPEKIANGAILITTSPEATSTAQRGEDQKEKRGAAEVVAGMRGVGEAEAEVLAVTSKGRRGSSHGRVPVKSEVQEMTPGAMAPAYAEEKECAGSTQEIGTPKGPTEKEAEVRRE